LPNPFFPPAVLGYALQKKGFEVTVYEKSSAFSRFGGPIQLASNALSCVNSLSPELFDEIMTRFTFTGTRKCGIKDGIRNTWYSVFDAITNLAEWNTLPYTGVIDRPDLQEILLDKVNIRILDNVYIFADTDIYICMPYMQRCVCAHIYAYVYLRILACNEVENLEL
jgi:2-polyprenyl-6-methoxyphenol hydroxylase-like FAD-dependent oxidoreductase